MYNSDKKILELIDILKFKKIITRDNAFCKRIEMLTTTLTKIKLGKAHFTVNQIEKICIEFQVNANWIFGIQDEVFISNNIEKIKKK